MMLRIIRILDITQRRISVAGNMVSIKFYKFYFLYVRFLQKYYAQITARILWMGGVVIQRCRFCAIIRHLRGEF